MYNIPLPISHLGGATVRRSQKPPEINYSARPPPHVFSHIYISLAGCLLWWAFGVTTFVVPARRPLVGHCYVIPGSYLRVPPLTVFSKHLGVRRFYLLLFFVSHFGQLLPRSVHKCVPLLFGPTFLPLRSVAPPLSLPFCVWCGLRLCDLGRRQLAKSVNNTNGVGVRWSSGTVTGLVKSFSMPFFTGAPQCMLGTTAGAS